MAMIPSLVYLAAARFGFKLADKRQWLPPKAYAQMALERLKNGDLQEAKRLNAIALKKNPDLERSQILNDLINMRVDARIQTWASELLQETRAVDHLKEQLQQIRTRLRRLNRQKQRHIWMTFAVLLPVTFLSVVWVLEKTILNSSVYTFFLGVSVTLLATWIIYVLRQKARGIETSVEIQEAELSLVTLERELANRQRKIKSLNEKIQKEKQLTAS